MQNRPRHGGAGPFKTHRMKFSCVPIFCALPVVLAGCSASNSATTPSIDLHARLLSPVDVQLTWQDRTAKAAGHTIEWATESNGEYVIIAFVSPPANSFVHPDVVPTTTCWYRMRPFSGPVSDPVEVVADKAPAIGQPNEPDDTWAEPKTISSGATPVKASIRNFPITPTAAPTDLKARLIAPTGIQFTWTDHAADEDGYMLEMKSADMPDFQVCALTGPDVNSFGFPLPPPGTKLQFRVRAFYFGPTSNLASQTTGLRPPDRDNAGAPLTSSR
jgi:hypothetical protein